jgi:hypothetical protein
MSIRGTYLSKLANIANALTLEGAEVSGYTTVLEVHHSGERLIEERPDGQDREVAGFGLLLVSAILLQRHVRHKRHLQPKYGSSP